VVCIYTFLLADPMSPRGRRISAARPH